jgi:hypothetical protein
MSVAGLWRNEDKTLLVRIREVAPISESETRSHLTILKGSIDLYTDGLKLYSVMPRKDYDIKLQEWFPLTQKTSVAKVIILLPPIVIPDFNKNFMGIPYTDWRQDLANELLLDLKHPTPLVPEPMSVELFKTRRTARGSIWYRTWNLLFPIKAWDINEPKT